MGEEIPAVTWKIDAIEMHILFPVIRLLCAVKLLKYLPRRTGWAAQRHRFWGNAKEGRQATPARAIQRPTAFDRLNA